MTSSLLFFFITLAHNEKSLWKQDNKEVMLIAIFRFRLGLVADAIKHSEVGAYKPSAYVQNWIAMEKLHL